MDTAQRAKVAVAFSPQLFHTFLLEEVPHAHGYIKSTILSMLEEFGLAEQKHLSADELQNRGLEEKLAAYCNHGGGFHPAVLTYICEQLLHQNVQEDQSHGFLEDIHRVATACAVPVSDFETKLFSDLRLKPGHEIPGFSYAEALSPAQMSDEELFLAILLVTSDTEALEKFAMRYPHIVSRYLMQEAA